MPSFPAASTSRNPISVTQTLNLSTKVRATGPAASAGNEEGEGDDEMDFAKELAGSLRRLPADGKVDDAALAEAKAAVDELRAKVRSVDRGGQPDASNSHAASAHSSACCPIGCH